MENSACIHYKGGSVKTLLGNSRFSLLESYKTYRCTVCEKKSCAFTNHNNYLSVTNTPYYRSPKFFQKFRSQLRNLGATIMTWTKFHTEGPQFWTGLWTLLLAATFCLVHVNCYSFLFVRTNTVNTMLKMLGTTIWNFVNQVPRIFAPCLNIQIHYLEWDFIFVSPCIFIIQKIMKLKLLSLIKSVFHIVYKLFTVNYFSENW